MKQIIKLNIFFLIAFCAPFFNDMYAMKDGLKTKKLSEQDVLLGNINQEGTQIEVIQARNYEPAPHYKLAKDEILLIGDNTSIVIKSLSAANICIILNKCLNGINQFEQIIEFKGMNEKTLKFLAKSLNLLNQIIENAQSPDYVSNEFYSRLQDTIACTLTNLVKEEPKEFDEIIQTLFEVIKEYDSAKFHATKLSKQDILQLLKSNIDKDISKRAPNNFRASASLIWATVTTYLSIKAFVSKDYLSSTLFAFISMFAFTLFMGFACESISNNMVTKNCKLLFINGVEEEIDLEKNAELIHKLKEKFQNQYFSLFAELQKLENFNS